MNERQQAAVVRQLVGGAHHFQRCLLCGWRFQSEHPQEVCGQCGALVVDDPEEATAYYSDLLRWGLSLCEHGNVLPSADCVCAAIARSRVVDEPKR